MENQILGIQRVEKIENTIFLRFKIPSLTPCSSQIVEFISKKISKKKFQFFFSIFFSIFFLVLEFSKLIIFIEPTILICCVMFETKFDQMRSTQFIVAVDTFSRVSVVTTFQRASRPDIR